MGVLICRDCGGDVSDRVDTCPHCGGPMKSQAGGVGLPVIGGVVIAGMSMVSCLGIVAAIAIPNFVSMGQRAKRAEVPANVDGIRIAILAYEAAFDVLPESIPPTPRSVEQLDMSAVPWGWPEAFEELGWAPDGEVRGTYWVEIDGDDFEVHGMIDSDWDFEPAHYVADRDSGAVMLTQIDVY